MGELRLRPLRAADERAFRAAHALMAGEGFVFGLGLDACPAWADYLASLDLLRAGVEVPEGLVPATFLVAEVAGEIVGRTSVRHELNDYLLREGGHIGYGVLPAYRRRGHATEILRQSLVVARAAGVDRVLVTCDEDNVASGRAIEACGGRQEILPGTRRRRYWIG
ncbi:MAG TPA: GNAT family N-acetyltransferase [Actinophytocola sp.]|jgi:predicted acetyltransferase|nr:GNAT family N-acetyltransferase [Actinophytocola sp.]